MDDFDWGSAGWSDWNQSSDYGGFDSGDYDWGGGYDYGDYDWGGGYDSGGYDSGGASWGAGQGAWTDYGGWAEPTAWWSGSGTSASTDNTATAGQGSFAPGVGAGDINGLDMGVAPAAGNSGVTGAFGIDESQDGQRQSLLSSGGGYDASQEAKNLGGFNANYGPGLGETLGNGVKAVNDGLKATRGWARENADLARLGIGLAGVYAARKDQKRQDELMQQTLADRERQRQMQEEAYRRQLAMQAAAMHQQGAAFASQQDAVRRNNSNADYWNTHARQSADEARSLYNPQELGIRGYASEAASTARSVQDIRDRMARKGKSQGAIDAEVRRAKVAGSANATTGYMKGYDTGRSAQTGALSSAKGLSSGYSSLGSVSVPGVSAPSFASNADLASYYGDQASANSNAIQDLLNYYLGNPLGASNDSRVK